ncbi:nucleolar protein dao-5-like isoform X2 [Cydia splendana]|uniref:nucleolar protein dao-5-like isoform X2 n=1 Tax=Cydia splendana TaxID=1100963 RepID=UPI002144D39D
MAPPPEYDKEPKAPDKSATNIPSEDSKALYNLVNEHQTNSDSKSTNSSANAEVENNKHVETLDDGQLRALLDEAITYKCPKDREGKSSLFKELLEEVEQDEQDEQACEAAARLGGGRARRGGGRGRRALPHSNSLQDLVAALAAEPAPRRARHSHHPPASVSARAIHGGSLPSGVDTSFLLSEEPMRGAVASTVGGAEYVATVRCVNPSPLAERRVSASDAHCPDTDALNRRSKPVFPMYTARATLEIGSGSVCSGRAVTTTTASNQVDSAIPFSCITSPEVVASCTTTASAQAAVPVDPKPARSMTASTFNGVPLPRAGPHFTTAAAELEFKQKSLDENGNSVQGFSSPQSGSSQQKKQRRKKSSKNETVIKSHHIDGYQGNKDLNEVLRFIESNEPERPKRHDDKKKRSAERRKDKQPRASSLDDLSRAAPPPARPARPAQPAPKPERRSWGDERQPFYFRDPNPEPDPELTDFQTVTKKRKPRRRADEPSPRPPRRAPSPRSPPSPRARSDRSNDSNDDLDSVHSLPSLPCRPAPPASYADIARTKHNIPDLIESCNYYGEGAPEQPALPEPAPAPGDADGYPALDPRPRRSKPPAGVRPRKEERREEPAPDVVASRPPVILLDSAARPRDMDGVTFGFDIDERLLGARRCDLLACEPVPVRAGNAALRYVQPAPPAELTHLHQIVDYVGTAWEDVVRCSSGKVRYFSE